jgi:hypothetical protein
MYNIDTCDHVICTHFPHPLDMSLVTSCQIWFPLIQLVVYYVAIVTISIFHYFVNVLQLLMINYFKFSYLILYV